LRAMLAAVGSGGAQIRGLVLWDRANEAPE